jgi:hypothetical protein
MRASIIGLILVVGMFWSADGCAQSAPNACYLREIAPHSGALTSLLARSDMQVPKPIPVVRPLRFQEIPTVPKAQDNQKRAMIPDGFPAGMEVQRGNEPGTTLAPETNAAR